jgi:hypothetical protein
MKYVVRTIDDNLTTVKAEEWSIDFDNSLVVFTNRHGENVAVFPVAQIVMFAQRGVL